MKLGIVGMGYVGGHLYAQVQSKIATVTYDVAHDRRYPATALRACDLAFVCVDTPMKADGSCNIDHVTEAVHKLPCARILIRSTVPPGTTDSLSYQTKKPICHFPEFYGEGEHTGLQRPKELTETDYCIVGGPSDARDEVIDILLPLVGPRPIWHRCTALESELVKYMENCYLATKVAFVNEFYDICKAYNANWHAVREGWLLDPRIGRSHSAVFPDRRGFEGNCLPKDLAALVQAVAEKSLEPALLKQVQANNLTHRTGH